MRKEKNEKMILNKREFGILERNTHMIFTNSVSFYVTLCKGFKERKFKIIKLLKLRCLRASNY